MRSLMFSPNATLSASGRSGYPTTIGSTARPAVLSPRTKPRTGTEMATMVQAVRLALHIGENKLGVTDILGQDVGPPLGGVFTATQGLRTAWNAPLDERGIVGAAMGL